VVIVALPAVGAILSLTAILLIGRSEGTLAGVRLAQWGWWLSVVFGLGYAAYYGATRFAVCLKAENFSRVWFDKLTQGKVNDAFVDTLDPALRQSISREDERALEQRFNQPGGTGPKGQLSSFRESDIVRVLQQAGAQAQIEPLGVREWDYKAGAYKVKRVYRIRTEEGVFDT